MENIERDDVTLTSYYKKRRILVAVIYFLSLLLTGAAIYFMNNQLLGAESEDPEYYSWTGFQHVFNDNYVLGDSNSAYYLVAGFYGALVSALFCLVTFIIVLFKTKPNLNVSYTHKKIKIAKVRNIVLLVLVTLVGLYSGAVFGLYRWILLDELERGITLEQGLIAGFFAGAGVLFALADYIYTRSLIHIYSQHIIIPETVEVKQESAPAEKIIPSSIFDELTSDLPTEEKKEEVKEPSVNYVEENQFFLLNEQPKEDEEKSDEVDENKPILTEYLQPMAYVPLDNPVEEVKENEPPKPTKKPEPKPKKAEVKKVEEKKEEPKKVEPKKEEPKKEEPKVEPEIEEESYSLKDILKFASTVEETPNKKDEKPREILTKAVISKTLKKDYPDVEQSKRENYTSTGLPLADTHYVNTPKGKKCFMYVYETTGNPLVLLKISNSYYKKLKDDGFTINKSQFPKSKHSWSSLVLDAKIKIEDVKKAIEAAMEFVKNNS